MGKDYMNAITQGVYVIGAKNGEKKNLMTAAWLTQISSRPNQILVAVSAGHYTAEMLQNNAHFTISVLAKGQGGGCQGLRFCIWKKCREDRAGSVHL